MNPSSKPKSPSYTTSPWPFAYLEKCLLVPSAISRTWHPDEDWHGHWQDYYYDNPESPFWEAKRDAQNARVKVSQREGPPVKPSRALKQPSQLISSTPVPATTDELLIHQPLTLATPELPITAEEIEKQARFDAQFGPIGSRDHRYVSQHLGGDLPENFIDEPPYFYLLTVYISYMILTAFGRVRDFFGKRLKSDQYKHIQAAGGYAALNSDFENFYFRRMKRRMNDCFSRPYESPPVLYRSSSC